MRVAIIGAGAAGLAALKVFQGVTDEDDLVAFDSQHEVGGTWLYSESSESWFASPVYTNLCTNLPPECMQFSTMPFPEETDQFPHHSVVHKYLVDFADMYNLRRFIRLNTTVEECTFDNDVWSIQLSNGMKHVADRLIVATGHFRTPHIPKEPIIDPSIHCIHSREYRRPNEYKNKTVVVVGGGTSALDIAREIAPLANRVILSMRNAGTSSGDLGEKFEHLTPIRADGSMADLTLYGSIRNTAPDGTVEFDDGTVIVNVDALLQCTGYNFDFPFFSRGDFGTQSTKLLDDNAAAVYNLFREMIYIPNTTLAFLGVDHRIWPFPVFEYQAQLLSLYWTHQLHLPSVSDMRYHEEKEAQRWSYTPGSRESHKFGPERQYAYLAAIYEDVLRCNPCDVLPKPSLDMDRQMRILHARKNHLGY
ncbi:Aste57867_8293 [Aphanomyces stellatus]|uniref:Aste57867_8293 protein n=1 Tax=Aphanomyces stellatus TaxID=120398 RepID=A0A485KJW6_9STRA|nr:hypothetical protein As57867_008262 [Aphanomyces stellatus]VFT85180.1 Aste57867_8293 [Aphanomyces stellatus]